MLTDAGVLSGAVFLSILHSLIPNHWGPFVLVGRHQGWSRAKLASVTFGAGLLHSTVTMAIGLFLAFAGQTQLTGRIETLESFAAIALILMGLILILGRALGRHLHGHFDPARFSKATDAVLISALVGMLSISPCSEILPLYLLAAADGWALVASLSVVIVISTSVGMTAVVLFFGDRMARMRWTWIEENGGVVAGALLVALGIGAAAADPGALLPAAKNIALFAQISLAGAWSIFQGAAPYILFGCLAGGLVYAFIRPERVAHYLGRGKYRPVINAALIGVPLPLCSCGVIPAAITLRRMGASRGATTAFLITTPETGVDSIAVTYALLGPIYAVFRPVAAFVTGVVAGILEVLFGEKDTEPAKAVKEESCPSCHPPEHTHSTPDPEHAPTPTVAGKLKLAVSYGLGDFLEDISLWLVFGFLAAGFILAAVPPETIERVLGGGLPGMLVVLIVSIPLYICASATTPLAAALLLKGASPGAALVLLLAGPATNTAGIVLLSKFLGRRAVVIYLASIAVCSLGFGLLLNQIFSRFGIDPASAVTHLHGGGDSPWKLAAAWILAALVLFHLVRRANKHEPTH